MIVFKQVAKVRIAQARMAAARRQVGEPASSLLARGREYPLTTVGIAAGAGFALGSLNVHPLRVPGVTSLLSGGMAGAMAHGSQWLAELVAVGLTAHAAGANSAASADSEEVVP